MWRKNYLFLIFPFYLSSQITQLTEDWKNDKTLKNASIGFCVLNAKTSEFVSEYNSRQALVPASTLKIITTAAAIHQLGANYRYETKIYYSGSFDKQTGILNGNLIICGSGDPSLQSENFSKEGSSITDAWAVQLKSLGLKEITGDIIGDASFIERAVPDTWIWEDISNYYGAISCGLSYRDNKFKLIYESTEEGSEAKLTNILPKYSNQSYSITSHVLAKGSGDEAYAYGDPFSFAKEIKGTIPPNKKNYEVEVALPDPALLCAEDLCASLQNVGIKCKEKSAQSNYGKRLEDLSSQPFLTHYSPTLDKIIYYTNQKSINLYCESILQSIGKGNTNTGLYKVKKYWSSRGLDTTELFMKDASGLSRLNTMTASFSANLLGKIYRDTLAYKIINNSLPIAGKQGSMSNIGKGSFIENNLRAKTGYITRVRAYSGYVRSKSGKELAFSIMFNNYNGSAREAKLKIEKFLVALSEL